MKLSDLQAVFFDFDGVILDSTRIKTETFRALYEPYGKEIVEKVQAHHLQHGGISRVEKIKRYHREFLNQPLSEAALHSLAVRFSGMVKNRVMKAPWVKGAEYFIKRNHRSAKLYIISGTPEEELREITARRNLSRYFQEILGSPVKKPDHVRRILSQQQFEPDKCVFVGDAIIDLKTAWETGTQFIGIQGQVVFPEKTLVLPDCTELETHIEKMM